MRVQEPVHMTSVGPANSTDQPQRHVPVPKPEPARNTAILPSAPQVRQKSQGASEPTQSASSKAQGPSAAGGTYTVQAGDSLYGISRRSGVSVAAIKKANGMRDDVIRVGQRLDLPSSGIAVASVAPQPARTPAPEPIKVDPLVTATPQPSASTDAARPQGYTPPKTARSTQSEKTAIAKVEADDSQAAPSASGIAQMRWPVRGRVLVGYGDRTSSGPNAGIDIMVPEGTPVKAAENGVVIYAGDGLKEFGNTVLIRHEDGLVTVYGHVGSISVSRGDKVRRGQQIARSGMTGNATVPELHFEVRKSAKPVNPIQFLDPAAG